MVENTEKKLSIAVPSPVSTIDIDWEERSPLQDYRDVEMPSHCPAGEIEIDWEEHIPFQFANEPVPEPRRRVHFSNKVRVVLAPSRDDIKSTRCSLWWKRQDYLLFQQSSYKEVRLYAVFHGMRFRDARRALYQNMDDKEEDLGLLGCIAPAKEDPDADAENDDTSSQSLEAVTFVEDAYGCYSAVIPEEEEEEEDHPVLLYVPQSFDDDLRDEEHSRHDYYNKYHSLMSRVFWVSAGGLLTVASMASFLTPLIGYYVLAILQVTFLGDFV